MIKVFLRRFLLLLFLLTTGGCWNYRELNQLAVVSGTGIDPGPKPGTVQLTVQIYKPKTQSGEGGETTGGGDQQQPFIVKSRSGQTIADAAKNFLTETDRRLYWPHNQVIIIGRDQARLGVQPVLDYFVRNNEPRPTIWVLVAEETANAVLKASGELEQVSATEIGQLIQAQPSASQNVMINLQDFTSRLMSTTTAPITTLIRVEQSGGHKTLNLAGTAVFSGDRLVGKLDGRQTRGLLWVLGQVRWGNVVVNAPGGKASLGITRSRTKVKPVFGKDGLKIKISIKEEGTLDCQMSPEKLAEPEMLELLARRKAAVIRDEIGAALTKARQLDADIFGFGELVHRFHPQEWRKLNDKWDRLFPRLPVETDIRCVIRSVGLIIPPLTPPE
jgi:spore germination protein KC